LWSFPLFHSRRKTSDFLHLKGEMMSDRNFFLSPKASKARLREAEQARRNRWEIIEAHSHGQVTRRDLIKMGLFTGAGLLVPISGLSPFARSAFADSNIPTGLPPSPLFGVREFSTPMPRFDVLPRQPVSVLNPAPTAQANTTQQPVDPALGGGTGPIEGRPPGPIWAHQQFSQLPPVIAIQATMEGAKTNNVYNPGVPSLQNSGINPASPFPFQFHPGLPVQDVLKDWTYNGTIPPKLMTVRYGEPVLFRLRNKLPVNQNQNGGFGITTAITERRTTASLVRSSSRTSFTIITTQSSSPVATLSIRQRLMLAPPVPLMPVVLTRFPVTGARR
jgi:hypothetical protein